MISIEFGSKKRGDFDISSDKDMLIIGDNITQLIESKERRKIEGYSVSITTTNKAKYMIDKGSLFFKHIIDEGELIEGNREEHLEIFGNWMPALDYQDEIDSNIDLLEILYYVPKTIEGVLAATDIVTISIRNILIRKLASFGLYVFSWEKVTSMAEKYNIISLNEKIILLHARQIKNYYRKGYFLQVSVFFLIRLMDILCGILSDKICFRFGTKKEIIQLYEKYRDGSYKQLRALELLCAYYGFSSSPPKFVKWIKDPNFFCLTKSLDFQIDQKARSGIALCYA